MKKLSVLLVVTLILSTFSVSFAEEQPKEEMTTLEKANYLHEKGMFDGVSKEEFVPALEAETNGEQAIKVIGSALGWEVKDMMKTPYDDVSSWAVPYVEYARLVGVTNGVGNGKFGAEFVNARRVITWLLASAHMDKMDVWENTKKYADDYELPMMEKEKLTRGDLVDIIYAAVKEDSKVNAYIKTMGYECKYVLIENGDHKIPTMVSVPIGFKKYPVVVGLHGTGSNKDEAGGGYKMLAPKLAKEGIAFVRFDFIGTGDSTVDYVNYNLESAVSDANAVIEYALKMEKVDTENVGLLGWSQGGTVALLTAAQNEKVTSVVTWAGAVDLAKNMITDEKYAEAKEKGYTVMEFEWRSPLKLSLDWYDDVKETDVLAETAKTKAAILAINGDKDDVVDKSNADEIAKASTNEKSKAMLIEEAGHTFEIFSGDLAKYEELSKATVNWFSSTLGIMK